GTRNFVVNAVDSGICQVNWNALIVDEIPSGRSVIGSRLVNDVIRIGIRCGLSAPHCLTFRLAAVQDEFIWVEMETSGEAEVFVLLDRNVHSARLVHSQKYRSKRNCGSECSNEYGDLLIFGRRSDQKTRFQILRRRSTVRRCDTNNPSDRQCG